VCPASGMCVCVVVDEVILRKYTMSVEVKNERGRGWSE
jgi:hypothetical protein